MTDLLLFTLGAALLIAGADLLVRGASRLAIGFGVSPLVIGLTVVAWGTSSPEIAVTLLSAAEGRADLAVGNVVGSNIFNVLVVLGLAATFAPLVVSRQLVEFDARVMVGASLLVLVMASDGAFGRLDGALLVAGAIGYTVLAIRKGRSTRLETPAGPDAPGASPFWRNAVFIALGLALLLLGSRWLVAAAISFARALGVSELVIGLTIVAAGTSLPEVATSSLAAMRGERDIAAGNAVGSNIANLLGVLGLAALVSSAPVVVAPGLLDLDLPVMALVAVACIPVFSSGLEIARAEGVLFLLVYGIYAGHLVLLAQEHPALLPPGIAVVAYALVLIGLPLALEAQRRAPKP
ncbi:MAG: calcium/sodium antiporter [Vicinamibacteria bacterium]|nr:calcium/sodium antiporter [Vicinamibacteria bacterium]